jgi:GNAT superfamily N-acetyltransferase
LEDRLAFWEWRNDQITRRMFNLDKSVTCAEHCAWFERMRKDENRILCVGSVDTIRIGSVRFDREPGGDYRVELYLKPQYSGRGYGPSLLAAAVEYLAKSNGPGQLWVTAPDDNGHTAQIYQQAGFSRQDGPGSGLSFRFEISKNATGAGTS